MIRAFPRTRRIGEQIRRELADLIRDELRDPRLALISMTSVEVSRDFGHARIYVTLLGDPAERAERVADLNHAAPLLRRELGRRMHIRTVPKLEFHYDEVIENAARLSALIDTAVADDARKHDDQPTATDNVNPDSEKPA